MTEYDVIVCGGGPSGSTTAFYAAKYKLKCCDIQIEHKAKSKYTRNKNLGIVHTRHLIKSHKDFFESNNWFSKLIRFVPLSRLIKYLRACIWA